MRFVKNLSSQSAAGLLQTLVGKPIVRRSKIQDEFDKTMRQAFKESLSKASEPEEDKFAFLAKGLMDLAKAVSAPKNAEFESKHVRAQGGRFGSKPKANETSDESQGPDLNDPKVAKKAWEDRLAMGEAQEDFQALKQELYNLGSTWATEDVVASREWYDNSLRAVEEKIDNSIARAKMEDYQARHAAFAQAPDKLDGYLALLREAAKYDFDNSNVGMYPETQKQYEEVVKPHRTMLRKLSAEFVSKGAAADPTFPRFTLDKYEAPQDTLDKVTMYVNASKQLGLKGVDEAAQEFIVKSAKRTIEEIGSDESYSDLDPEQIDAAWDESNTLLNLYGSFGPKYDMHAANPLYFNSQATDKDWKDTLFKLARSTRYTVNEGFGNFAAWSVDALERFVDAQEVPDVNMRFMAKTWQEHKVQFTKTLMDHQLLHGDDAMVSAMGKLYQAVEAEITRAEAATAGDKWGKIAAGAAMNPQPFLDFFTAMRPMVRKYVANTIRESLISQGPEERASTFTTAFEGRFEEKSLENIALRTGNNLTGAETILRSAEPHEQEAIMQQVDNSWDHDEHGGFTIEPRGVFVVDKFAKHEVGFKQWAEQKDHVGEFYHGTAHAAAPLILSGGLRVPKNTNQVKTGTMLGYAIYLAPKSSKSAQYGDTGFGRGEATGVLIGVKASLGQVRDVKVPGDYAPSLHEVGPETNVVGNPLNESEYKQIKDIADSAILLVNKPEGIYVAYGDQFQGGKPKVNYYKKQNGSLVLLGNYDLPLLPSRNLMGKSYSPSLSDSAAEFIRSEFPVEFDADYDMSFRAVAEVMGSTEPLPTGPQKLIFGDRLTNKEVEDIAPGMLAQTKLVLTSLASTGVPGYDGHIYLVGRGVSNKWFVAKFEKTGMGRLKFKDMKIPEVDPIREDLVNKNFAIEKGHMLALISETFGTPNVAHLANALEMDHIGRTESGYDSVHGLSRENGGTLYNDEFAVYQNEQVVPDYVISYIRKYKDRE